MAGSLFRMAVEGKEIKKKVVKSRFEAHLPCSVLPKDLFYYSLDTADARTDPSMSVTVCTDSNTKIHIRTLGLTEVPPILPPHMEQFYHHVVRLAEEGNPVVHVLQDCGIHKQIMYAAPVYAKNTIIGVLVGLDLAPDGSCTAVVPSTLPTLLSRRQSSAPWMGGSKQNSFHSLPVFGTNLQDAGMLLRSFSQTGSAETSPSSLGKKSETSTSLGKSLDTSSPTSSGKSFDMSSLTSSTGKSFSTSPTRVETFASPVLPHVISSEV